MYDKGFFMRTAVEWAANPVHAIQYNGKDFPPNVAEFAARVIAAVHPNEPSPIFPGVSMSAHSIDQLLKPFAIH